MAERKPLNVIADRIMLDIATITGDACGHEIAAFDILQDLNAAGYKVVPLREPVTTMSEDTIAALCGGTKAAARLRRS